MSVQPTARRADGRDMVEPSVTRWTRYGKDRLYVTAPDGRALGWYDLATNESHCTAPDDKSAFDGAVRRWFEGPGQPLLRPPADGEASMVGVPVAQASAVEAVSDPGPAFTDGGTVVERDVAPGGDLTANRPGDMPRAQAVARRRAAPVQTFLARMLGLHTEERAWRIGADGEEKVAARLARLVAHDPRWRVLHSVPVGAGESDIDHVLVGPAGVFTLNAKHHPGARIWVYHDAVRINGTRVPYVRNARFEAARAAKLLTAAYGRPVEVTGVIVPVNANDITIKAAPTDVVIVNRRRVDGWLASLPAQLDDATVDAIFEAARRPETWRTASDARR